MKFIYNLKRVLRQHYRVVRTVHEEPLIPLSTYTSHGINIHVSSLIRTKLYVGIFKVKFQPFFILQINTDRDMTCHEVLKLCDKTQHSRHYFHRYVFRLLLGFFLSKNLQHSLYFARANFFGRHTAMGQISLRRSYCEVPERITYDYSSQNNMNNTYTTANN